MSTLDIRECMRRNLEGRAPHESREVTVYALNKLLDEIDHLEAELDTAEEKGRREAKCGCPLSMMRGDKKASL